MNLNKFWLICLVTVCPALDAARRGALVKRNKTSIVMVADSTRRQQRTADFKEAKEIRTAATRRRRLVQECNCLRKIVRAIFCCSRR